MTNTMVRMVICIRLTALRWGRRLRDSLSMMKVLSDFPTISGSTLRALSLRASSNSMGRLTTETTLQPEDLAHSIIAGIMPDAVPPPISE